MTELALVCLVPVKLNHRDLRNIIETVRCGGGLGGWRWGLGVGGSRTHQILVLLTSVGQNFL